MKKNLIILWICFIPMLISAQDWVYTGKTLPEPILSNALDQFGQSVDISGNYAVVGAPGSNNYAGYATVLQFSGQEWEKIATLAPSDPLQESRFGNSVSISGDVIVVGCYKDDDNGTYSGSAYVYVKPDSGWSNMTETAKLLPSDGNTLDNFGRSVSISGNCIAIGAPANDDYGEDCGSIYIFEMPEGGWINMTETALLSTTEAAANDYLGYAVDIDGDYVVAGAYQDQDAGIQSGSAWVFRKPVAGWMDTVEIAKLSSSDLNSSDKFGYAVSIFGNTIAIGAMGDDESIYDGGAVYVFRKPAGEWTNMNEAAKLTISDPQMGAGLGSSVAIYDSIIVSGAMYAQPGSYSTGAVYLFKEPVSGWENSWETAELLAQYPEVDDQLGISVAVYESKVMAGANLRDEKGISSGALYYYTKPADGWKNTFQNRKVLPVSYINNANERYGASVDIYGNYAVVGAPGYNKSIGAAYVLKNMGSGWENVATLTASTPYKGGSFGKSVAIYEDRIVVGAPAYAGTGAAYLFAMPEGGWKDTTESVLILSASSNDYDRFGVAVDIYKDLIAIGADNDGDNGTGSGSVYIFEPGENGWEDYQETLRLNPSDNSSYDQFGYSLDIWEDYLVIGAVGVEDADLFNGAAYVFKKPEAKWTDLQQLAILKPQTAYPGDYFGESVAIDSNVIVVGAVYYDGISTNTGAAFVYEKPDVEWTDATETALLQAPDAELGEQLGKSVNISGDYILAGAPYDSDAGDETGSAYLFIKPAGGWSSSAQSIKLLPEDTASGDDFGYALALDHRNAIISSYKNDDLGYSSGSVYTWEQLFPVNLTSAPADQTDICAGSMVELAIAAEEETGYQWEMSSNEGSSYTEVPDSLNYSGTRSDVLMIDFTPDLDGNLYRCRAFNALYSVTSDAALLTEETESPIFTTTIEDLSLEGDESGEAVLPDYTDSISVSDNCDGPIEISQDPAAGTILTGQNNTIVLTARDAAGNAAQTSFLITVNLLSIDIENSGLETAIHIRPNPAHDFVWIDSEGSEMDEIALLDLNGKVLFRQVHPEQYQSLDLSGYEAGIYIIRLVKDERVAHFRIVKE